MLHSSHLRYQLVAVALVVVVFASGGIALARVAPTLAIQNNANETLLVHIVGPMDDYVPIVGNAGRTVTLTKGTYRLFFRWGTTRYRYTKLDDPFTVADGDQMMLTLYAVAGNAEEEPSSDAEFNRGR